MNRFRSAWVVSVACLLTLIACGPRVEKARTTDQAPPPNDQVDQGPMKSETPLSAAAALQAAPGSSASATVTFTPVAGGIRIVADVQGVPAGKHGLHLHETGECAHATDAAG